MAICDNIRAIRLKKGLTQKQVAEACGTVDATIRMYELGKANPKPATVAKIAKALGVSAAELYGVDWMPGSMPLGQEIETALYQSALPGSDGTFPIGSPNKKRLIVAFDRLNADGQMEAIKRMEEMAYVPAYQTVGMEVTSEEDEMLSQAYHSIVNGKFELFLMERGGHANESAVRSSKDIISRNTEEVFNILLKHFVCKEVAKNNMPMLRALQAHAEKEEGFGTSSMDVNGTEAITKGIRCTDIVLHGSGGRACTWCFRYCPDLQVNKLFLTKDIFEGMEGLVKRKGDKASVVLELQGVYDHLCNYYDTPEGNTHDRGLGCGISPLPQGVSLIYYDQKKGKVHERKFP